MYIMFHIILNFTVSGAEMGKTILIIIVITAVLFLVLVVIMVHLYRVLMILKGVRTDLLDRGLHRKT